ncbi:MULTISPECIES: cobalamin biosynthesis protein CobW [Methylosinus]|uniref:Cobalamin biosynthesis protein CobW n=1 Tax=Methylosinus trichosporium (strain ATCC 35070 / NCIMB 11131 / UNIQEM 75 / OB3b) TaxID=595536 RepID=A0A2D2D626_METT3|nr:MULTISPECIES: cobalamin biosynthesis protein CobW [Methylosinus]ATQ70470.1 cobalamin biosynthesis protein CobW [Methylosinus trichosporium OB3b]OBS50528.1 cobalamin biosynthesis protein CobW [Methylosinus sp. 3S-1]
MTKIPTTVITGFLGSGKTTLIRHLLHNAGGRRLAVIVNEFGDIGVDGDILRGCGADACAEEDIVELANGCICCTVADDFLPTMTKLLERADPPEHILIETSGLALPKPLLKAFAWPDVRTRATVDGVIVVIDAAAVAAGRFAPDEAALAALRAQDPNLDHETPLEELFEEQLGSADLVVLNKTDLLDAAELAAVERDVLAAARAGVVAMRACEGRLHPSALLGLGLSAEDDLDSRPSHHEAEADHDHDDFTSFVLHAGAIEAAEPLAARLGDILARHDVLRLKGVVAVRGKPARLIVQAVGPRVETYYDRRWREDESRMSRLVVIGEKGFARENIEAALIAALV